MAFFETSTAVHGPTLGDRTIRAIRAVGDWNASRQTRRDLGKLSDHELSDIGLVRGDIDEIGRG